jgi:omega-6 fatty acid desaturase (delta-12 desaturase)
MTTDSKPDNLQPIPLDQAMPHRKVIREWLTPLSDRSTLRAFLLLIVDTALFMGLVAGTVYFESIWLKLLCGTAAGFVIGRLFILGHDACHQSLTPHRELNKWIGRYAFLYSLTPFSLWDTGHNVVHHGYTNLKGVDFVWTPLTAEEFAALGPIDRLLQYLYRSGWAPGLYYLIEIWWKREFFPNKTHMPTRRPIFFKDSLLVTVFGVVWVAAMTYAAIATEQSVALTLLIGVLLPFLFWNTMIGFVVYVHHTHVRVSWHNDKSAWTKAQPFVSTTVHLTFPMKIGNAGQVGRNVARPHHCSALLLGLVLQNCQGLQTVRFLARVLDRLSGPHDQPCARQFAGQNLSLLRALGQNLKCGQGFAL